MTKTAVAKAIIGFIALFGCYHAAEYMMLFKNSPAGFLAVSLLFFPLAWLLARWQGLPGLAAWGMVFQKKAWEQLGTGLAVGITVYTLYTFSSFLLDIERIKEIPPVGVFVSQFFLFALGTFFSSLTEDVLTRGYLYRFFNGKMNPYLLILFSSLVYLLNHIYRLTEGPAFWSYILIIGFFLMLAMVRTGNIWLTLGLHWAGNIIYHSTHSVMHTVNGQGKFPGSILYVLFLLLLIPVTWYITKKEPKTA
jgi:hypothetical protein